MVYFALPFCKKATWNHAYSPFQKERSTKFSDLLFFKLWCDSPCIVYFLCFFLLPDKKSIGWEFANLYLRLVSSLSASLFLIKEAVHCKLNAVHCKLNAVHCKLNAVHCKLNAVHCKLNAAHCKLNAVHC